MLKKILLFLILILLCILIYFSATSKIVRDIKDGKDFNILFVINDSLNHENIKLAVAKYNSLDEYIKVLFIDENITILHKTKKSRTLKEKIVDVKFENRVKFIRAELENIFDNKFELNYYIDINEKDFKNIIKIFSKQKDLEQNLKLFDTSLQPEIDRNTHIAVSIKIFNYIYNNFNRLVFINLIKSLYNKDIILKTNFQLKDLFLLYSNLLNENKNIKYADIPTLYRRNRIELDINNKQKIIDFFEKDEFKTQNLKVEVLNTTNKNRLAIKAVDKLRENNFDVIDWGASSKKYEYTIMVDLVNNYEQTKEIKKILNCGEIVFRPADKTLTDVSVLLGQDCSIYDKLDR